MAIVLHVFLLAGGLGVALVASGRAVAHTRVLAAQLGIPGFVVGVGLVAIGTDLPEVANSIAAHAQGEGDVNVGDSVGSALTQYTLVLGVLPLLVATLPVDRRQVLVVSALTASGLGLAALLAADGRLGRADGALLVLAWAGAIALVVRLLSDVVAEEPPQEIAPGRGRIRRAGAILLALGFVAFGATVAVRSLVLLAESAGVPEFVVAFFGASLGTSAPELLVVAAAVLRGAPGIAFGDAMGSSLVDSTLSIGAGPLVAPADVTARFAVVGSLYALTAVVAVAVVLAGRRRHDRRSAAVLVALYLAAYPVLLGLGEA